MRLANHRGGAGGGTGQRPRLDLELDPLALLAALEVDRDEPLAALLPRLDGDVSDGARRGMTAASTRRELDQVEDRGLVVPGLENVGGLPTRLEGVGERLTLAANPTREPQRGSLAIHVRVYSRRNRRDLAGVVQVERDSTCVGRDLVEQGGIGGTEPDGVGLHADMTVVVRADVVLAVAQEDTTVRARICTLGGVEREV